MANTNVTQRRLTVQGLCAPPVTAFKDNGEVNLDIIPEYVQHFVDFGIKNTFVTGTNGEGLSLSVAERKQMAERWMKESKGKLSQVIIHIGAGCLPESQELAKHAEQIGADAIACVGPTYMKPETMDSYIAYMEAVASAAPKTPFILYDIDFVTGITYDSTEFFDKAKALIPTLGGTKHTSPSMSSLHSVHVNHPDMELLMGSDDIYLEGLSVGVTGNIVSSYMGNVHNRMRAAFERGDMAAAQLEQSRAISVGAIRRKMKLSIPGGTKTILRAIGVQVGSPRLPLAPVPDETVAIMKVELMKIGFFEWAYAK